MCEIVRIDVRTAVSVNIAVFWDIIVLFPAGNVDTSVINYMTSHPSRFLILFIYNLFNDGGST
jgi:hypothetical protein